MESYQHTGTSNATLVLAATVLVLAASLALLAATEASDHLVYGLAPAHARPDRTDFGSRLRSRIGYIVRMFNHSFYFLKAMKTLLPLFFLFLLGCQSVDPEPALKPADPLTQSIWCAGNVTYLFDADGTFTMKSGKFGNIWGGSWSYIKDRTDLDINLHYGPNRQIQNIRLRDIQYTKTSMTARWTDEIAQEIPFECQVCKNP